jgi:hypothetical protein
VLTLATQSPFLHATRLLPIDAIHTLDRRRDQRILLHPSHSLHPCTSRQGSTVRDSAVYRRWNTRYSQRKVRLRLLPSGPSLRKDSFVFLHLRTGFYILRKSRPRNRLLVTPIVVIARFVQPQVLGSSNAAA